MSSRPIHFKHFKLKHYSSLNHDWYFARGLDFGPITATAPDNTRNRIALPQPQAAPLKIEIRYEIENRFYLLSFNVSPLKNADTVLFIYTVTAVCSGPG